MSRNDRDREEYADWSPPNQSAKATDEEVPEGEEEMSEGDDRRTPAEMREPLLRDRARDRLGVTPQQWYVIETFLLVVPYPIFVFVYFSFDVNEMAFLAVTLLYSLIAIYTGLLS